MISTKNWESLFRKIDDDPEFFEKQRRRLDSINQFQPVMRNGNLIGGVLVPAQQWVHATKESSELPPNQQLINQLQELIQQPRGEIRKQSYTVNEFAGLVHRSPYQVRKWCRNARVKAKKTASGPWMIPHEELIRYQNELLRPDPDRK